MKIFLNYFSAVFLDLVAKSVCMVYNNNEVVTSAIKVVMCGEVSTRFSTGCGKLRGLYCGKTAFNDRTPVKSAEYQLIFFNNKVWKGGDELERKDSYGYI